MLCTYMHRVLWTLRILYARTDTRAAKYSRVAGICMPSLHGERRWRNGGTRATARPRIPSNSSPVVQRLALGRRECLGLGQDTVPVLRTCAAHRGVRRTGASGRPRDACRSVRSARPRLRARHGTRAPRSAAAAGAHPSPAPRPWHAAPRRGPAIQRRRTQQRQQCGAHRRRRRGPALTLVDWNHESHNGFDCSRPDGMLCLLGESVHPF